MSSPSPRQKKAVAHAKAKWDAEVKKWNEIFLQYYRLGNELRDQQTRVHEAYHNYLRLSGE